MKRATYRLIPAGDAMDFLLKNSFTEAAGARKGFPKVAMIITDGKSQDPVQGYAKKLRNTGVEIFTLGMLPILFFLQMNSLAYVIFNSMFEVKLS